MNSKMPLLLRKCFVTLWWGAWVAASLERIYRYIFTCSFDSNNLISIVCWITDVTPHHAALHVLSFLIWINNYTKYPFIIFSYNRIWLPPTLFIHGKVIQTTHKIQKLMYIHSYFDVYNYINLFHARYKCINLKDTQTILSTTGIEIIDWFESINKYIKHVKMLHFSFCCHL